MTRRVVEEELTAISELKSSVPRVCWLVRYVNTNSEGSSERIDEKTSSESGILTYFFPMEIFTPFSDFESVNCDGASFSDKINEEFELMRENPFKRVDSRIYPFSNGFSRNVKSDGLIGLASVENETSFGVGRRLSRRYKRTWWDVSVIKIKRRSYEN